jgi:hypothetical protein
VDAQAGQPRAMQLIEIFLPLSNNRGIRFGSQHYADVRDTLTNEFGGLTAFSRAPADGSEKTSGHERNDELIVFEVMVEELDRCWWSDYRRALEVKFEQDRILIRATHVAVL